MLGALGWAVARVAAVAAAEELKVPDNVPGDRFDFEARALKADDGAASGVGGQAGAPRRQRSSCSARTRNQSRHLGAARSIHRRRRWR